VAISILITSDKTRIAPIVQSNPKYFNQHVTVLSWVKSLNNPMLMPSNNIITHNPKAKKTTSQKLVPSKPPPTVKDALEEIKKPSLRW